MASRPDVCWLIQRYMLDRALPGMPDLAQAARAAGYATLVTTFDDLKACEAPPFPEGSCVVAYGTHQFVTRFKARFARIYQPGCYHRLETLSYSAFATPLGDRLLNADFYLLPFGEIERRAERNFAALARRFPNASGVPSFFVRPNAVTKAFTGLVITQENAKIEFRTLRETSHVADDLVCVIAPSVAIESEYRFVIADRTVVAGSEYRYGGTLDIRSDVHPACAALAREVASLAWQPDRVYVCDVAMSDGAPKVVELNTFSCAGLYLCDTSAIVEAVSQAAWREYLGED